MYILTSDIKLNISSFREYTHDYLDKNVKKTLIPSIDTYFGLYGKKFARTLIK